MSGREGKLGGQLLVESLRLHGVTTAFTVPGESFLPVLDAFYHERDVIKLVVCRHECAAANMAEATGKLSGAPGVAFVTRGPGATHASIALHTAYQDSTPLVLFVGQIPRHMKEREAFQEIDYVRLFSSITKWTAEITDANRIPEMVNRAFHTALSGRRGPVVLALPEDMLADHVEVEALPPYQIETLSPSRADMDRLRQLLSEARQPFMIVGGSGWDEVSRTMIMKFADQNNLPVGASFRRQDIFDNTHPNYAGDVGIAINPRLAKRIREADLLLAIGTRLGDIVTGGYTLVESPQPKQKLVHVHRGAEELGKNYRAELSIVADMNEFASAACSLETIDSSAWSQIVTTAHSEYMQHSEPTSMGAALNLAEVVCYLSDKLPAEAVITNGAGNFTVWAHRFYQFRKLGTQLAPTNGAMGYGVPAAIAAKIAKPEAPVVCIAGDGDFLMTGQELATAKRHQANVIILIINNGMYGTIRMHQERNQTGNTYSTSLENPDFVDFAKSFGAFAERVEKTEDFAAAFERALAADRPAVLELMVEPEYITPQTTISQMRNKHQ